jgi:hypothetical protein
MAYSRENFTFTIIFDPFVYLKSKGPQTFQKSMSHLKILGAKRVNGIKVHAEWPQILGATV